LEDVEQEIEDIIIQGLGHPARRTVLKIIHSTPNGALYTELLGKLRLSTGTLNYHLGQLEGFVEKDKERRYVLTPLGEKAISLLDSITRDMGPEYRRRPFLRLSSLARASCDRLRHTGMVNLCAQDRARVSEATGDETGPRE
jgi:DNA-binding transcriptional ArsR family regulator